jgi:ubiquinone/menaquinone biosynthesis C-methylase UbiE
VLADEQGATVTLADVLPMSRTPLPHIQYDGKRLPFEDNAFDVTLLYFVLHHAEEQELVLREALRVTSSRVLIVESVYEEAWDLKLLSFLDTIANRLRSGGLMNVQEEHLYFRTVPIWKKLFEQLDVSLLAERQKGRWIHKQAFFVLATDA